MLVLSRHRDESIVIGDNIVITVIDIRGDKVRLGIEAPKEMPTHRYEVYQEIKRQEALHQECLQREKDFIEKNNPDKNEDIIDI
jgi:carbon storage regulator